MRSNAVWTALLLVVAVSAHATAGDGASGAPKKQPDLLVRSEDEWFEKVREIQKIDSVSIKKADVLAKEAARTVVRVRVKIRDIRRSENGIEIDVTDVAAPRPGAEHFARGPVTLPAADGEAISSWAKWDRLVFKVKPKVAPDGALEYVRLVSTAADVDRTPNPGIEYPEPPRPLTKLDSFRDFVDRYTRTCSTLKWRLVWQSYCQATSVLFPMSAVVKDPEGGDQAVQARPRASAHAFEITDSTGVTGYGLLDATGHPMSWVWADVEDPQVAEAIKNGARAEMYFHVEGLENATDCETREGRFKVTVTFGRLR